MEPVNDNPPNVGKKMYSLPALNIAMFFGGPLGTGIMARHNFKVLDRPA